MYLFVGRSFHKQWAGALLKRLQDAEITLPVGRFVVGNRRPQDVTRFHSLKQHSVTFLMQDCDWRGLSLLDTFLRRAAGEGSSWKPIVQKGQGANFRTGRQRAPPIELVCPPGFKSAHEVTSPQKSLVPIFVCSL